MSVAWFQRASKYYNFISESIDTLHRYHEADSVSDTIHEDVEKIVTELSIVIPKYGISLPQLNLLLNIILDYKNTKRFKVSIKNKLCKALKCYELINFQTFLRVLGSFKLNTFANDGRLLHKSVQIKLSDWLVDQFTNFKLDKNLLKVLSFIYNLISINYIQKNIMLLTLYLLELGDEIDKNFKVEYFLDAFKLDHLIELYDKDPAVLPLLLVFRDELKRSGFKNPVFEDYYYKILRITPFQKITKRSFGVVNEESIEECISLKLEYLRYSKGDNAITVSQLLNGDDASSDLIQYQWNLKHFTQLIDYLHSIATHQNTSTNIAVPGTVATTASVGGVSIKRRKLEDVQSTEYQTRGIVEPIGLSKCLSIETYLKNIDKFESPVQVSSLVYHLSRCLNVKKLRKTPDPDNTSVFSPDSLEFLPKTLYVSSKVQVLNTIFNFSFLKLDDWLKLTLLNLNYEINYEDVPIFEGLLVYTRYTSKLLPTIKRMISGKIELKFSKEVESKRERLEIIRLWDFVPYLKYQSWDKFKPLYKNLEELAFADARILPKFLNSIVSMFDNWKIQLKTNDEASTDDEEDPRHAWTCINTTIQSLIDKFSISIGNTQDLQYTFPFVILLKFIETIPFESILISNIVLPPIITYGLYFSGSPILIDAICRHITHTKKYYSDFGSFLSPATDFRTMSAGITEFQLSQLKAIHNTCVMDFCNIIWRDKAFDKNEKSVAKGFLLPVVFVDKLLKQRYHHYDMGDHGDANQRSSKRVFNLFFAPAFTSIISSIVKDLELASNNDGESEAEAEAGGRLLGPLDLGQYNRLVSEGDWISPHLSEDYDYLRIEILKKLEHAGFDGVVNLLASSLRSLRSKQASMMVSRGKS